MLGLTENEGLYFNVNEFSWTLVECFIDITHKVRLQGRLSEKMAAFFVCFFPF